MVGVFFGGTIVKEISIAITLTSSGVNSHYSELVLTRRGVRGFSRVDMDGPYLE